MRLTQTQFAVALLVAIALQFSNPYIAPWMQSKGFVVPPDDYGTLLATVTSIGAVFIGLYYTAISAVGGSIYARVPSDIRDLLAQERVGSVYMSFLALLTYLGISLLAFRVVGLSPIVLAPPIILLGAGLGIFAFVLLGSRAFGLFDPTTLSYQLFEELRENYEQMQAGGHRWLDQTFQRHSHHLARRAVETLVTLADITAKEPHLRGQPFAGLCRYLLLFLVRYELAKKRIPTQSLWYRQQYIHPDWYLTDDSTTSLIHETAGTLPPRTVSDQRWIESELIPIVRRCLELNILEERESTAHELLGFANSYVRRIAEQGDVLYAFRLIEELASVSSDLFYDAEQVADEESLYRLGICDQVASLPITVLLAYVDASKSSDNLGHEDEIDWTSKGAIYKAGFPVHTLRQLEWLQPRLAFEMAVEGTVVTPSWYSGELISQAHAENLASSMQCLVQTARRLYEGWRTRAIASGRPWLAASFMSRESEYWKKWEHHSDTLKGRWAQLMKTRRLKGLCWPELDVEALEDLAGSRKRELLKSMADTNTQLSLIPRPESHPDFAGQFLHTVGEGLMAALCDNERETIEDLFPAYLAGSLLQYERLRPRGESRDWQAQINLRLALAPLLDLLDLSGYAFVLSDFHDSPELKRYVVDQWDQYLSDTHAAPRLRMLAAAVALTESAFELPHRSILRTRWKQVVEHRLSNLARREVMRSRRYIGSDTLVLHKSALVRLFGQEPYGSFYDGIDVFISLYVRERHDGKDLDFGPRRRDLGEPLAAEEKRFAEAMAEGMEA